MAHHKSVNLVHFGDQTANLDSPLRVLLRSAKHLPGLDQFLRHSTDVLQTGVRTLPVTSRAAWACRTLGDFLLAVEASVDEHKPAIVTVLLTICQLGYLYVHLEQQLPDFLRSAKRIMVGLCTGMLTAATAACITNASDVLRLGPEITRIAFRLGVHVSRCSHALTSTYGSWAVSVSGVTEEQLRGALQQFNETCTASPLLQPYISVIANSSFTVAGPPLLLRGLTDFMHDIVPRAHIVSIPIFAAYHSGLIYPSIPDSIIGNSSVLDQPRNLNSSLISTHTGLTVFDAMTLRDYLHIAVLDILQRPLHLATLLKGLMTESQTDTTLTVLGPSNAVHALEHTLNPTQTHHVQVPQLEHRGGFAIIGMAGRFPGADSLNTFWDVLEEGLDLHRLIPANRFSTETHYDVTGRMPNTTLTPYGCFLDHPDMFDARLFNLSAKEAAATDPSQRLLLMTTYEALQMAGYSPDRASSGHAHRVGTFIGQTSDDYRETNAGQDVGIFWTPGGMRAFGPGRLNYHFGWDGPSYSIDTACSSSMAAIEIAAMALRNNECDMAVAGGVNIMTSSDPFAGLSRGGFLSPTGSCKTWDDAADGYCRGEGVGVLVMKRLEDAIRSRDPIQAVIRGISTNHSAEAISITHPHAHTQERLFTTVFEKAGVKPTEVDYVEMHGTGTQAGDVAETSAVARAFSSRSRDSSPLYLGAVKSNIGHGESVSGVASIIKSVLMFQKSIIPPHVGIKGVINPNIPSEQFRSLNIQIPREKTPFLAGARPRKILVNNFNAAGGNTSLLLEEYTAEQAETGDGLTQEHRSSHIVTVSAKTPHALRGNMDRLIQFLQERPQTSIPDLAYSTTARQMHHPHRKAFTVSTVEQLVSLMSEPLNEISTAVQQTPSAVFLFAGQGSLYQGMGQQLMYSSKHFFDKIQEIDLMCHSLGLPSILPCLTDTTFNFTQTSTVQEQLVTFAVGIALASLWHSWGVTPRLVCGHSLGTYAALCIAGVLSLHDSLYLVGQRAKLIEQYCERGSHAMMVIKLSPDEVQNLLLVGSFSSCEVSCYNSPHSTVVGGTVEDISSLARSLSGSDIHHETLQVPYAFHSAQLDQCLQPFEALARRVQFNRPAVPVASTCLGVVVSEPGVFCAEYLSRQARTPVLFLQAIQSIISRDDYNENSTFWVDIGARPFCAPMTKSILGKRSVPSLLSMAPNQSDWLTLSQSVARAYSAGFTIDWDAIHREHETRLNFLPLPPYSFDLKSYWLQYRGDWLITKHSPTHGQKSAPRSFEPTPTIQRIEKEELVADSATVTFVSDLNDPNLRAVVTGHLVKEVALCPSSVYADMALTAAAYIWSRTEPHKVPAMEIQDMTVQQPLILEGRDELLAYITISKVAKSQSATMTISTRRYAGDEMDHEAVHAQCVVIYGEENEWMAQWAKQQYLIQSRVHGLETAAQKGEIHKLKRSMIYRLFGTFVKYSKSFQGMNEVWMDSDLFEGAAQIRFSSIKTNSKFTLSPHWLDSLIHLSGFILNVSDAIPEDTVYISHGWKSMRIATSISATGHYQAYVHMQGSQASGDKNTMSGDVYILDQNCNQIIGLVTDVKFKAVKRKFLDVLLPSSQATPAIAPPERRKMHTIEDINCPRTDETPFARLRACISDETGIPENELTENTNLAEIGLESLLSFAVVARLRQELQVEITRSALISSETLGDLRPYLQATESGDDGDEQVDESSSEEGIGILTPTTSITKKPSDLFQAFKSVIFAESEVDPGDLVLPDTNFADLGIDSLLGLAILNAFQNQTGCRLSRSFFSDYPTFADAEKYLQSRSSQSLSSFPLPVGISQEKVQPSAALCQSVQLQGEPEYSGPALFLLPDGSGSAGSYAGLPALGSGRHSGLRVWGLNSPFVKCTQPFDVSLTSMANIYVTEIVRIDPDGPYLLGGWSVGGILAFEAARLLREMDRAVQGLFLIDAPCPGTIPPLSQETVKLLDRLGVITSREPQSQSQWRRRPEREESIRAHFKGTIQALKTFKPQPMRHGDSDDNDAPPPPRCLILWASSGVWESIEEVIGAAAAASMREEIGDHSTAAAAAAHCWIMEKRSMTELGGGGGWETLLPIVEVEVVIGDHFTIMKSPQISEVAKLLSRYIDEFLIRGDHGGSACSVSDQVASEVSR